MPRFQTATRRDFTPPFTLFIVTKSKLKALLFRAYEYGANEVWRFNEWVAEQIENIRKKQGKL